MNNSIDRRISYKLVIDTETCPLTKSDFVSPYNMFVYDIGYSIVDKRGRVYLTRSFINSQIFNDEQSLMKSAYYSDKLPQYYDDIKSGKRQVANFYTIRKTLLEDLKTYKVKEAYAHNMRFDYGSLNNTQRWLTKSKYRYFFPKNLEICDTLKMAKSVIGKMTTYKNFCKNNGFVTKSGNCRFTAEILYKFITRDLTFIESHTALEDVMIEKEILAYCYKQKKKMVKKLWD